ncbi:AMP-dependent synthetase/ligase [Mycobacterium paraintracellulare]|uniref:AMP-dependent synthetase/ligase n=2 Tax=Mycobacterium avium complex (MAC) TaxID=120793 RepID=UPI001928EC79|nr:long-chain fatty acid--CoA ligase [Mycobacterium paraintracellulare]BCP14088.1 fatty-acid--CoA ligase [Mycobacterium paraintracellulare]
MHVLDVANNPREAFARALQARTLCEAFQITAAARADQVALRSVDGGVSLTFAALSERVRRLTAGLAALGVRPGDTVGIMLTNRPEFHIVDLAAMHLGALPFSIYNTSAHNQIEYLFSDAGNRIVITERAFVDRLVAVRDGGTPLDMIVVVDGAPEGTLSLDDVEAQGDPDFDFNAAWSAVGPDDLLTLIYTSGTTGPPKGVELTHHNLMSQIRALQQAMPTTPGGRFISFLPSAHIGDRWGAHYCALMVWGFTVTPHPVGGEVLDVVEQVRPTVFQPVPRIWEKAKAKLEARLESDPNSARRALLRWAIDIGIKRAQAARDNRSLGKIFDIQASVAAALIGDRFRRMLGLEKIEWVLSGSAPTPRDVFDFFSAIGVPICEVWGMSETSLAITVNPRDAIREGTVGLPLPGIEVKVADDGELLVRGATVMRGYRNKPEQTAEAIDADGWLHSGDIGTVDEDGYVRIVDRKKEIIINAAGKNMSPANIESRLRSSSPLIGQVACIGDGRLYNVALICLDPDAAAGRSASDPAVIAEVAAGVDLANSQLSRVEQIKKFRVVEDYWLPGSDELTPTMKVKRRNVTTKYATQIEDLYST